MAPSDQPNSGKPGAAFERLVGAVHKRLDSGAQVSWNEKINGAQIDIAIRGVVGGHPVFIIVECRDYDDTIGIDHVRGLVSVKKEVGADRVILVTRTGFTAPALGLAATERILTCTLRPAAGGDYPAEAQPAHVSLRIDLHGESIEDIELETTTGERIAARWSNQLVDDDGKSVFLDRLVKSWLYHSDEGRAYKGDGHVSLTIEPPIRFGEDSEDPPRIKTLRCRVRPTVVEGFSLWESPAEWVFHRQTPEGTIDEPKFFDFEDLTQLAETLRHLKGA